MLAPNTHTTTAVSMRPVVVNQGHFSQAYRRTSYSKSIANIQSGPQKRTASVRAALESTIKWLLVAYRPLGIDNGRVLNAPSSTLVVPPRSYDQRYGTFSLVHCGNPSSALSIFTCARCLRERFSLSDRYRKGSTKSGHHHCRNKCLLALTL